MLMVTGCFDPEPAALAIRPSLFDGPVQDEGTSPLVPRLRPASKDAFTRWRWGSTVRYWSIC